MAFREMLFASVLLSSLILSVGATQASERESNSVEVVFYQLSSYEWTSKSEFFKTQISTEAVTYCSTNYNDCGLASTSMFLFTSNDVGVSSGPTEESKNLKVSLYVDFPSGSTPNSSLTYVINAAAVTTILKTLHSNLETLVGADITYIADDFYSIEPDAKLNKILIPIAFIVLLAITILAVALHKWNKSKEEQEKKVQRALEREKRKKNTRIAPVLKMENENKKSGGWPGRLRKKSSGKQASVPDISQNGGVHPLPFKGNMATYNSQPSRQGSAAAAPIYEDTVSVKNNTLPPLPNPGSEEDSKEQQEKKEKRKRRREKRRQKDGPGDSREESEADVSKTESLDKNVIPVENDTETAA